MIDHQSNFWGVEVCDQNSGRVFKNNKSCHICRGDPKTKFLLLFLSAVRPSVQPKKYPDFAPPPDLRCPTWTQSYTVGPILYTFLYNSKVHVSYFIQHYSEKYFHSKNCHRMSGEVFMVGWSVGWRGVGRRRALSDGGRRTDGSFDFSIEPPYLQYASKKENQ